LPARCEYRPEVIASFFPPHLKCSLMQNPQTKTTGERFEQAVAIMARLRGPGGCPWDREQTFDSIKRYTVEETYEVLEAIDNRDWEELPGELGDLLLQVLFYAQMAKEDGTFSIDDVLDRLSNKLVDRHPHVFGDAQAETSSDVVRNWEAIKAREKEKKQASHSDEPAKSKLAGVSSAMPALLEAHKLSSRAADVGFDWPNIGGLIEKLKEETHELEELIAQFPPPGPKPGARGVAGAGTQQIPEPLKSKLEEEVGDLFFTVVNLARYFSLDSESALKKANRKFRRRFQSMEEAIIRQCGQLEGAAIDEMEVEWQRAKQRESAGK